MLSFDVTAKPMHLRGPMVVQTGRTGAQMRALSRNLDLADEWLDKRWATDTSLTGWFEVEVTRPSRKYRVCDCVV